MMTMLNPSRHTPGRNPRTTRRLKALADQSSVESVHGRGTGQLHKTYLEPARRRQAASESDRPAPPRDARPNTPHISWIHTSRRLPERDPQRAAASNQTEQERLRSLLVHCSLRLLRLALGSRCLPFSLADERTCLLARSSRTAARQPGSVRRRAISDARSSVPWNTVEGWTPTCDFPPCCANAEHRPRSAV